MTKTSRRPVLAIVQEPPAFLNKADSINRAIDAIERAAKQGAHIIAFAECWVPGYPVWLDFAPRAALWGEAGSKILHRALMDNAVQKDDDDIRRVQEVVDKTGTYVVLGTHERDGGTLYNTSWIFAPGTAPLPHRKLVPTYTERLVWGRGDGSTLHSVDTPYGTLGSLICWEHWMPFARAAMHAKHETIHVAQWPIVKDMHQVNSRHYAFEGRTFVMAAGSILSKADVLDGFRSLRLGNDLAEEILASMPGTPDSLIHNGGSAIIAPTGDYVAGPVYDRAEVVLAEVDLNLISEEHQTFDSTGHYSRPDIFELSVNTQPQRGVVDNTDE